MSDQQTFIPRPLVRTNQWFIFISVIVSWFFRNEWILLFPLVIGLSSLLVNFNPMMKLAKLFLIKQPGEYIPEDKDQQQFNQWIAVILLLVGFISFLLGWLFIAYIATAMVALASFIAIQGFCVGCFIRFHWKQYLYRKMNHPS